MRNIKGRFNNMGCHLPYTHTPQNNVFLIRKNNPRTYMNEHI